MHELTNKNRLLSDRQTRLFPMVVADPVAKQGRAIEIFAKALMVLGYIFVLVGGYFIIFGPETIYYDRFYGPTLLQYLQMYPGPIATTGFILASLAPKLAMSAQKKRQSQRMQAVTAHIENQGIRIADLSLGYSLDIQPVENCAELLVQLVAVNQTGDEQAGAQSPQ